VVRAELLETKGRVLVLSAHNILLDRRITAEANTLAAAGYEVTIVSIPVQLRTHSLDPRVHLVMPESAGGPNGTGKPRPLEAAARAARRFLPYPCFLAVKAVWRRFCQLRFDPFHLDFFLENTPAARYDFIHCHDLNTLPAGAALRNRHSPGAAVVYDSHELFPYQTPERNVQRWWEEIERRYIAAADAVVTVNESVAHIISSAYGVDEPLVLYNSCGAPRGAAGISQADFLEHFRAPAGGTRFLFQGSLGAERNLENLIEGFAAAGSGHRLFLLGGGPAEGRLRRICRQRGAGNVHFGGWVGQDELLSFARFAHAGVIPYRDDGLLNNRYCTPNKLFEFLEAELPVCAAELPEVRRIVKGSGVGEVYPMGTPGEVAAAVRDFSRRLEAGAFSREALGKARCTYSWQRQAHALVELYSKLGGKTANVRNRRNRR